MKGPPLACAIYTRKSSEEGLEQEFNSLHAQREACEAYVKSQQHEGWKPLSTHYDDGGYSGGNTDRPALQRLLADIAAGKVRIVVVYKVDRLTRSLADFAKIVEQFDAQGVSFVSVTQQFNTTSSMGRLTLNVLLSFAQFEREVTGERIRDKIAASKRKGMWMGGVPPIGYRCTERTLVIVPAEADFVRSLYRRYLELGCVRKLQRTLNADGIRTPKRVSQSGRESGGARFSRGNLYRVLSNEVYIGRIVHRQESHPGLHAPILDQELWDTVQARLAGNRQGYHRRRAIPSDSFLAGRIFDGDGHRLIPSHSQKRSRRYRYYLSEPLVTGIRQEAPAGLRIPAEELESAVIDTLRDWLRDERGLLDSVHPAPEAVQSILAASRRLIQLLGRDDSERIDAALRMIHSVVVTPDSIRMTILPSVLHGKPRHQEAKAATVTLEVPIQVRRCGLGMRLLVGNDDRHRPKQDERLVRLLGTAKEWRDRLTSGKAKGVAEIAAAEGVTNSHVTRMIYRACLAPDIVKAILAGTQPPEFNSEVLKQHLPLPIDWDEQRRLLGFKPV